MLEVCEVPWQDPVTAFMPFAGNPVAALLHGDGEDERGRWSYIAPAPFCTVSVDNTLSAAIDGTPIAGDPFQVIKNLLVRYTNAPDAAPAPFHGGAVGFFSYELANAVERLPSPKPGATHPLVSVGLYDVIAAFDHRDQRAWVMASGFPERELGARKTRAAERTAWLARLMTQGTVTSLPLHTSSWVTTQDPMDAERCIGQAIDYIHAGDIFQANITQRFIAEKPPQVSAWQLFRKLRHTLPSPFGAYVSASSQFQVLSASPERFLKVNENGQVETRPIKGTRPRGQTPDQDRSLAERLRDSAKDRAENLMIVDLMRNDLSRVCEVGSIAVPQCNSIETFAQVHHLVSVVTGQLRADKTAVDLLRACFPGGSVTGAPKVRAMEIIHELEPTARGPYCGAIAWLGFDGAMDSSIVIRSLVVNGDEVLAHAGGGIVADSDPKLEYEEAMVKIRPLLSVLDPTASI